MKDRIYVLVEGEDDRLFFRNVFEPILRKKYEPVFYFPYAKETKELLKNVIESIHSDKKDYFILGDLNTCENICQKKDEIMKRCSNRAIRKNIIIVVILLEGWYLAGITNDDATRFGIDIDLSQTNTLTIEDFNKLNIKNVNFFKSIVRKHFDYDAAKKRNESFNYFYNRIT